MKKHLTNIALITALVAASCTSTPEQQVYDNELHDQLIGEWTGVMSFGSRSLDIQWRFEQTGSGELVGYMGQVDRGGARILMDNLVVTDAEIHFNVNDEGNYVGRVSATEVVGIWTDEGLLEAPLNMKKM